MQSPTFTPFHLEFHRSSFGQHIHTHTHTSKLRFPLTSLSSLFSQTPLHSGTATSSIYHGWSKFESSDKKAAITVRTRIRKKEEEEEEESWEISDLGKKQKAREEEQGMDVLYMDEKWKPPKKGAMSRSNSCSTSRRAAMAESASGPFLKASASMREGRESPTAAGPRSFSRRCANLVKEQRAKFYIMRRCVTMLICWRDLP